MQLEEEPRKSKPEHAGLRGARRARAQLGAGTTHGIAGYKYDSRSNGEHERRRALMHREGGSINRRARERTHERTESPAVDFLLIRNNLGLVFPSSLSRERIARRESLIRRLGNRIRVPRAMALSPQSRKGEGMTNEAFPFQSQPHRSRTTLSCATCRECLFQRWASSPTTNCAVQFP